MITWSDVVAIAPELADLDDLIQGDILSLVNVALNEEDWRGGLLRLGRLFLAAHFGTIISQTGSGTGSTSGPVVREKVGELERQYADTSSVTGTDYSSTSYGRTFSQLAKQSTSRLPIVI